MKTYQLINLDPLKLQYKSLGGLPSSLTRESNPPQTPEGYNYVENLPIPEEVPAEGFIWTRELTTEAYGWTQTEAPAESTPEWYEQPAWRVRAIADITPYGDGLLIDAIRTLVDSIEDPVQKAISNEVFFHGNTLERDSSLLVSMAAALGLDDAQLDDIFQQAAAIEV